MNVSYNIVKCIQFVQLATCAATISVNERAYMNTVTMATNLALPG